VILVPRRVRRRRAVVLRTSRVPRLGHPVSIASASVVRTPGCARPPMGS